MHVGQYQAEPTVAATRLGFGEVPVRDHPVWIKGQTWKRMAVEFGEYVREITLLLTVPTVRVQPLPAQSHWV